MSEKYGIVTHKAAENNVMKVEMTGINERQ
jgi:hypothetical protein